MLLTLVSFPGVIVHEIAHLLFCRLFRVPVLKVCYFRLGNPAGYVLHEKPQSAAQHVCICTGPFLVNTVLGALIALPGVIPVITFESASTLDYVLVWLGVSIAMHAFPSTGDAKVIWASIWSDESSFMAKLVGVPIVALIYAGALGSVVWLDVLYGVGVALALPMLLVHAG